MGRTAKHQVACFLFPGTAWCERILRELEQQSDVTTKLPRLQKGCARVRENCGEREWTVGKNEGDGRDAGFRACQLPNNDLQGKRRFQGRALACGRLVLGFPNWQSSFHTQEYLASDSPGCQPNLVVPSVLWFSGKGGRGRLFFPEDNLEPYLTFYEYLTFSQPCTHSQTRTSHGKKAGQTVAQTLTSIQTSNVAVGGHIKPLRNKLKETPKLQVACARNFFPNWPSCVLAPIGILMQDRCRNE